MKFFKKDSASLSLINTISFENFYLKSQPLILYYINILCYNSWMEGNIIVIIILMKFFLIKIIYNILFEKSWKGTYLSKLLFTIFST